MKNTTPQHPNTQTPQKSEAFFTLSKSKLTSQLKILTDLNLKVSYSYKTNHQIGNILQETSPETSLSIHAKEEIQMIKDKSKIIFFTQAESTEEIIQIINQGILSFVIDNELDLENLLKASEKSKTKISISMRMKFFEHRIGTGKYFVYGMHADKINYLIQSLKNNPNISSLGIHVHRKSQNTSEWEIVEDLKDSIKPETLKIISSINLGGGLPVEYKSYSGSTLPYILSQLSKAKEFLDSHNIQTIIEPGRFLAAPPISLHTKIIQIQERTIILNTTIYNCALDTILTETKMLVKEEIGEKEEGKYFLLKGNSPTTDDIFRYKVKLKGPKINDEITFTNAGAYNYTTDFFGYKKLKTKIVK